MLQINFVGESAGQDLMINEVNEHTTMADVARKVLQFTKKPTAKFSFITDSGEKIELKVDQSEVEGDGKDKLVQTITGYYSTGLSCEIKTNITVILRKEGKSVEIPFHKQDKVSDLKRKACQLFAVKIDGAYLRMGSGYEIDDDKTLKQWEIYPGDCLYLFKEKFQKRKNTRGCIQIFIKTLQSRTLQMFVKQDDTILSVKSMVQEELFVPIDQQRLVYAGRELDDDKYLQDYNIQNEATIHLIARLSAGGELPLHFVDVEKTNTLVKSQWSKVAPEWRIAGPGLAVEGICTNNRCKAKGQMVIHSAGFGDFNFDKCDAKCPICSWPINPVKPGFNNCLWKIDFQKTGSSAVTKLPWTKTGDYYHTYDQQKAGMAEFTKLIIHTKKLVQDEYSSNSYVSFCLICHFKVFMAESNKCAKKCGHHFHDHCALSWRGRGFLCPIDGDEIEDNS
ncbi:MAG: putative ring and ubiquitin domain containing protein [Streblomastix strix]|uniref:Putative ring and ubiquitin domain containing protein n=1 Tax=Streblomastix strix TaxID=222440 RepID=A0A5J4X3K3_9EUKA|nr:MAG: putative ring and ubiquitin domain containing protein [Streblomastix strix]